MAIHDILIAPHPILKRKADPVETIDDALRTLLDDMLETMYAAPGIGLAGPQIGVSQRIAVVDLGEADDRKPLRLINPEILETGGEEMAAEEGCLSLPDQYAEVIRPERVSIRYRDEQGVEQNLEADGLLARCLQHEIDHLDGILFVDHISMLKRQMLMRKLRKSQRAKQPQKAS